MTEEMKNVTPETAEAPEHVETMEDYKEELEASFKRVKEGDILTGTVAGVTEDQVLVDLKYYAGGVINKENINGDPDFQLQAEIHPGDEITATVISTDDGEGNIELSMKEANENMLWDKFAEMLADRTIVNVKIAEIVKGVAEGCVQSGCALIGGETAEHPGVMPEDDYDLAGFTVGIVDKDKIIDGSKMQAGDVLVGVASSGVHSNGFSLVRKVFGLNKEKLETYYEELGCTLGEALLTPTRLYVKPALAAIEAADVKAISHITGGGFYENIPRMLKDNTVAVVQKDSYTVPPIFDLMAKKGNIDEQMMYNTFNMGIGMVLAVDPEDVDAAMKAIRSTGDTPYVIGHIENGEKGVQLC